MNIKITHGRTIVINGIECYILDHNEYLNNMIKYKNVYVIIKEENRDGTYNLILKDKIQGTITNNGYIRWIAPKD